MSNTRWRVRRVRPWEYHVTPNWVEYVGIKGKARLYGETIADVFNSIASRESEQP